jgi:hypothetical protein
MTRDTQAGGLESAPIIRIRQRGANFKTVSIGTRAL